MNYLDFPALFQTTIQMLYALGFFSELIVVILVTYLLYDHTIDFWWFFVGILGTTLLNRVLKPVFRDPRPRHPVKFLESETFPRKIDYTKNSNYYGMPSGHSQNVAFCLAYLYWTLPQESFALKFASFAIGVAVIFERWWFRNHTAAQLAVGVLVGVAFARFVVWVRDKFRSAEKPPQQSLPKSPSP